MSKRNRGEGELLSVQSWHGSVDQLLSEKIRDRGNAAGNETLLSVPSDRAQKDLAEMSNEEILVDLRSFVGTERQSLAKVVVYLAEVEERRIHLELACSSMFDFCTRRLGFSEGEAFRRLTAARLVRRFPTLLDAIASGGIHLSSLVLLRDLLTEKNVDEIVAAASGKTKREVEELVARMAPKPDVETSIRKLPDRRPSSSSAASRVPPQQLQAIAEHRYKVQLTADEVLRDKLELARDLMSHQNPSGDLAIIIERAVDLLIEKLSKAKLGKTARPRRRKSPAKHGYVTRDARRETFDRDGRQCSFVGENGERCPSRAFLEVDHVAARALGGSGEAENLRVFCRAHNQYAAERVFDRAHVEARIRSAGRALCEDRSACLRPTSPGASAKSRARLQASSPKTPAHGNSCVRQYLRWDSAAPKPTAHSPRSTETSATSATSPGGVRSRHSFASTRHSHMTRRLTRSPGWKCAQCTGTRGVSTSLRWAWPLG